MENMPKIVHQTWGWFPTVGDAARSRTPRGRESFDVQGLIALSNGRAICGPPMRTLQARGGVFITGRSQDATDRQGRRSTRTPKETTARSKPAPACWPPRGGTATWLAARHRREEHARGLSLRKLTRSALSWSVFTLRGRCCTFLDLRAQSLELPAWNFASSATLIWPHLETVGARIAAWVREKPPCQSPPTPWRMSGWLSQ